jgi:high-affinity K+ transport system ATPase subunit B
MKKLFNKWILPVCLLLILFTQPIHYYLKGNINPAFIVVVIALLPAALKGLEYKISKQLERVITIFAAVGLIYVIWDTFF